MDHLIQAAGLSSTCSLFDFRDAHLLFLMSQNAVQLTSEAPAVAARCAMHAAVPNVPAAAFGTHQKPTAATMLILSGGLQQACSHAIHGAAMAQRHWAACTHPYKRQRRQGVLAQAQEGVPDVFLEPAVAAPAAATSCTAGDALQLPEPQHIILLDDFLDAELAHQLREYYDEK